MRLPQTADGGAADSTLIDEPGLRMGSGNVLMNKKKGQLHSHIQILARL